MLDSEILKTFKIGKLYRVKPGNKEIVYRKSNKMLFAEDRIIKRKDVFVWLGKTTAGCPMGHCVCELCYADILMFDGIWQILVSENLIWKLELQLQ